MTRSAWAAWSAARAWIAAGTASATAPPAMPPRSDAANARPTSGVEMVEGAVRVEMVQDSSSLDGWYSIGGHLACRTHILDREEPARNSGYPYS